MNLTQLIGHCILYVEIRVRTSNTPLIHQGGFLANMLLDKKKIVLDI